MESTVSEDLLQKDKFTTIHITTEVFKSLNRFSPAFTWDLFERKSIQCDLHNDNLLKLANTVLKRYAAKSVFCGIKFQRNKNLGPYSLHM